MSARAPAAALADVYAVGKTLYPERFRGIDLPRRANEIFRALVGAPVYTEMERAYGPLGAPRLPRSCSSRPVAAGGGTPTPRPPPASLLNAMLDPRLSLDPRVTSPGRDDRFEGGLELLSSNG